MVSEPIEGLDLATDRTSFSHRSFFPDQVSVDGLRFELPLEVDLVDVRPCMVVSVELLIADRTTRLVA